MQTRVILFLILSVFLTLMAVPYVGASTFDKGVLEYNAENYEEAVEAFEKAHKADKKNPNVTLYLALSYREVPDFDKALHFFRETLRLNPSAKGVGYHIADMLYSTGEYAKALSEAEAALKGSGKDEAGKTHYLLGLIYNKLKRHDDALKSFESAKVAQPSLAVASDYQIGVAHYEQKSYKLARAAFAGTIGSTRDDELSAQSREYLARIDSIDSKGLDISAGVSIYYDDNVLAVPVNEALAGMSKEGDYKKSFYASALYDLYDKGGFDLKAGYYLSLTQYGESDYATGSGEISSQDTTGHYLSIYPSISDGADSYGATITYSNVDIDYANYSQGLSVVPYYARRINDDRTIKFFAKFDLVEQENNFFLGKYGYYPATDEDKDAKGLSTGLEYYSRAFGGNGLYAIKAELERSDADGANHDYLSLGANLSLTYRTSQKVALHASIDLAKRAYSNVNSTYGVERDDLAITFYPRLAYSLSRAIDLNISWSHARNSSNIDEYEYTRNVIGVGLDYRF